MEMLDFTELMAAHTDPNNPPQVTLMERYVCALTGRYTDGCDPSVEVCIQNKRGFFGWLFRHPKQTLQFEPMRRVNVIKKA